MVTLSLLGVLTLVVTVWWYGRKAADVDPEVLLDYRPAQVTRVLARDGTVIGELVFEQRRTLVRYDELPPHLIDAFLAAEDADFFEHDGLDWPGIARALAVNLASGITGGGPRQGASTITQQVIKNTLLSQARSVERKSQEIMLAGRVEATLGKRRIFEIYVNQIYFGEGRYGVEEAARWYFGKSAAAVDLGEAAVLAALPRAPGVVTCYRRVAELEARRDYVLRQMVEHGFAEAEAIEPFLGKPIEALSHDASSAGLGEADEFVDLARAELIRRYGEDALPTLGATVHTTVDLNLQRVARAAGERQLEALEARHGYGEHARPLSERARKRLEARAPELVAGGRTSVIIDRLEIEDEAERGDQSGPARLHGHVGATAVEVELPTTIPRDRLARRFPVGGAVSVQVVAGVSAVGSGGSAGTPALAVLEPGPELAVVLADVRSGELLAVIGGRHFSRGSFDRSRQAHRQPGSTFKPVVYGAALRSRAFTAASTGRGGPEGEPMRLREALAQSDNAVALALMRALGPEAVHAFARDLGISAPLGPHVSLALGTSELTLVELLTAYLTLARGGSGMDPQAIRSIEVAADLEGNRPEPIIDEPRPRLFSVDAAVAGVLTSMLTSVVSEGTGKQAAALGRPVAGKTGTTDEARDAWFAGF
ncbi:MAG: transglycosylase domain-containing protein, partial [Myxococcales bacterium]|nr:transglycosylase domain-containing protein [Myxococcales bacterium]